MAVDSTFNDSDSPSDEAPEQSPSLRVGQNPTPPRPPRPAKRPSPIARVPMPVGHPARGSDMPISSEEESAPPSPVSGLPGAEEEEFPLTPERKKVPSVRVSRESFDHLAPDPLDCAPSAPLTPWGNVPELGSTPPATPKSAATGFDTDAVPSIGAAVPSSGHAVHSSRPHAVATQARVPDSSSARWSDSSAPPVEDSSRARADSSPPATMLSSRRGTMDSSPSIETSDSSATRARDSSPATPAARAAAGLGRSNLTDSERAQKKPSSSPAAALWSAAPGASPDLDSSPPVGIEPEDDDDDREDTVVGEVPRRLLDIAAVGDENTRAYTAPQELIELARRKREERMRNKAASPEAHSKETQRPPAHRRTLDSLPEESFEGVMPDDESALRPAGLPRIERDSAPPVARPSAGEREARTGSGAPSAAAAMLERLQSAAPASPSNPAPAVSRTSSRSERTPESEALSLSTYKTPWFGNARRWLLIAAVCIAVGVLLSRWHVLERLLAR